MRLWSKTILSIVSVTILLGTLVLLHPFLLPPLVEYRLHRYAKKHWGAALQAERASRDGSHWVLEKLVFTQEATGKVLLTVERAEFGYTLHLLARQLELQVKIDNPHLILHSASHESPRSKGWPIPTFGLLAAMLNTQGKIAIDGGKLSLADRETTPLAFSFHGGWDKHFRGKGQLHFTDDRLVKASIAPEHNHVQLQQADCAVLAALLGPAWIDPSWLQVTDGMVSGQFTFHHHLLQGNLVFENLQVRHPLLHLEGRYPSLTFQGDAATGTAMLTQPASLTWRANSLHPFQLQMQTGMISWNPQHLFSVAVQGEGGYTGEGHPLHLEGHYDRDQQQAQMQVAFSQLQGIVHANLQEPEASLTLQGNAADALALTPPRWQKLLGPVLNKDQFQLEAKANTDSTQLQLAGEIRLAKSTFTFGTNWTPTLTLQKGWIATNALSLDQYLAPYLQDTVQIAGVADLYATFDANSLILQSDARNVTLENSHFTVHMMHAPAFYYFDLINGTHGGVVPLTSASYLEKHSGLLFTDVNGNAFLGQQELSLKKLETLCQGIYLAGELSYNYPQQELRIYPDTMQAKVAHVQELCAQFQLAPLFLKLPLEGNVLLRQQDNQLLFRFLPEGTRTAAIIKGSLADGSMAFPHQRMTIRDLSLDFDYNTQTQEMLFSDLQGILLIGSPSHVEEYSIAGDHVRFADYAQGHLDFDVWVGDKNRDIIRAVGSTQAYQGDPRYVEWTLDKTLSHFGDVHPAAFELILKDWSQLEYGHLHLDFQLSTLLHDLQRFSRTGFLFLSRHFLTALNTLKQGEGNCQLDLQYDNAQAQLSYQLASQDLKVDTYAFKNCTLSGHLKDRTWRIDQLQLDDLSLATDITPSSDVWQVHFLGIRLGDSLIAGLEGNYYPHDNLFESQINLLEMQHSSLFTQLANRIPFSRGIVKAKLRTDSTFTSGDLVFNLENSTTPEERLIVKWERNPGIQVRAIEGSCAGFDLHLIQNSSAPHHLQGEVALNFPQATALMSDGLRTAFARWKLGGRYLLQGSWGFEENALRFVGDLESHNCIIHGYVWDRLTAQVQQSGIDTTLQQVLLEDPAGKIQIRQINVRSENPETLAIFMPQFTTTDLQPSLLRLADGSSPALHPIVVKTLTLDRLQGNLLNPDSLQGEGILEYATPVGHHHPNLVQQITKEILNQTGVSLAMLTPVEGSFSYRLDQGKIVLTKMRDTYSAERLSKFYLAKEDVSTIDFDGNLNLQVRIRPTNPLLKFAELLTLHIEGTVLQPQFTLLK